MGLIYFSSDYHLNHKRICEYSRRPFNTVEEMNETIIKNHNDIVKPNDTLYFLGDFAFGNSEFIRNTLRRLNGRISFVIGNHDRSLKQFLKGITNYPDIAKRVINLGDYHEVTINKQPIVLCHYPMSVWSRKHYGSWCLSGHSHYNLPATRKESTMFGKILDVGVDGNNFKPYLFDEIKLIMDKKPITSTYTELQDHHKEK